MRMFKGFKSDSSGPVNVESDSLEVSQKDGQTISTFSGNIDSAFGGTVERTSRYAPGKRSEFSTGGGGARVSIESFSGNVELLKK